MMSILQRLIPHRITSRLRAAQESSHVSVDLESLTAEVRLVLKRHYRYRLRDGWDPTFTIGVMNSRRKPGSLSRVG